MEWLEITINTRHELLEPLTARLEGLGEEGREALGPLGEILGRYDCREQRAGLAAVRGRLEELSALARADSRRRGYGTQCMSFIFNHLREQGFRYLSLWVFQENQRAAAFYRKLGFSPDGAERPVAPDSDILEVRFLREL